jgi:ComF family protein
MFTSPQGNDHLCADCIMTPKPFGMARAAGVYDGPLRALIRAFKFGGKTMLARPLGTLAFDAFHRHWEPGSIDLLLPVPLHGRRMRRRGFNQAWLLIRDWPERYRAVHKDAGGPLLCRKALIRHRRTPPQTGLDADHRRSNIRGAFHVTDAAALAGKRLLLVDDVYTTGATVGECARVLMAAGAGRVDILTVARTLKPHTGRRSERRSGQEAAGD